MRGLHCRRTGLFSKFSESDSPIHNQEEPAGSTHLSAIMAAIDPTTHARAPNPPCTKSPWAWPAQATTTTTTTTTLLPPSRLMHLRCQPQPLPQRPPQPPLPPHSHPYRARPPRPRPDPRPLPPLRQKSLPPLHYCRSAQCERRSPRPRRRLSGRRRCCPSLCLA